MEDGIIHIHESEANKTNPNETQKATYINIEKLLRYLDENDADEDGNTAFTYDDDNDDDSGPCTDIINLLRSGADVNTLDSMGETPLLQEICKGHDHCTKLLIRAGADVSTINDRGCTALMMAAEEGHVACMLNLLFISGAGINQFDASGETALVKAYRHNHVGCVELLLEAGANVNILGVSPDELFTWLEDRRQQEIKDTMSGTRKSSMFTRASRGASVYTQGLQLSLVQALPDGASVKQHRSTFLPQTYNTPDTQTLKKSDEDGNELPQSKARKNIYIKSNVKVGADMNSPHEDKGADKSVKRFVDYENCDTVQEIQNEEEKEDSREQEYVSPLTVNNPDVSTPLHL